MALVARKGGAIVSGTTTPVVVDLAAIVGTSGLGVDIVISCPTQDVWFCASDSAVDTALLTTATAATDTGYIADRAPIGLGKVRHLYSRYLIVRTVAGADLITIKPVS